MSKQDDLNDNVQERLRALAANQQVMVALLVALIETHPKPAAWRRQYRLHYETLLAGWLNTPLAEDWLDEAAALHRALDGAFDRPSQA